MMGFMKRNQVVMLVLAGMLAACSPKVDSRGYVSNTEWKNVITIGVTTKDQVLESFGSPSAQSDFGDETWYYISSRKETTAFLAPEVVEQTVMRLTFDANGVVTAMDSFDKNNSKDFEVAKRVTPTEGHALGFFEQVIGNIGRFNKGGDSGAAPGRRTSAPGY